jgi:beta-aspartyl-peptidase (threonine type)
MSNRSLSDDREAASAFNLEPVMKRTLVCLVSLVGITAYADEKNPPAEQAQIRKVLDDQATAWNKGDLEGFMKGYWNSKELTFYSGKDRRQGWQETLERYRKRYQGEGKEMGKLTFSELEVQLLGADVALVKGHWQVEMKKEKLDGLFTLIMRKTADGWRIVHDHTSG